MADINNDVDAQTRPVKKVVENGRQIEFFGAEDQIRLENHESAKVAAGKPHFGVRMTRCIPPGGG